MGDLVFGIIAMLVAAALANLFIIPKLFSLDARAAIALLGVTALGLIAAVATLVTETLFRRAHLCRFVHADRPGRVLA